MTGAPDAPRACIVTQYYPRLGQTFVNRHIEHLFGGNTCVIADEVIGENIHDKPVYERGSARRTLLDSLARPVLLARRRLTHGTSSIPIGADRRAVRAFLLDQKVDVVLGEFGTKTAASAEIADELDLPCYSYFRGADASYPLKRARRLKSYRRMLPHLSGMFAVSRFLLDNLARQGIAHDNAHVVPSGADLSLFRPGAKRPLDCLAVGRMVEKKAPQVTLRAFALATANIPEARLTFIGDGSLLEETRRLAADLGVSDRVAFAGMRPHAEVRDALSTAGVFLQHSVHASDGDVEGLPTSIQEALACGCLVVSTRHAGIPEAVDHGVNGWLSEEHDLPAFAANLRTALTGDHSAMAAAARATAEARFDNSKLLAKVEAELRRGVAARRAGGARTGETCANFHDRDRPTPSGSASRGV